MVHCCTLLSPTSSNAPVIHRRRDILVIMMVIQSELLRVDSKNIFTGKVFDSNPIKKAESLKIEIRYRLKTHSLKISNIDKGEGNLTEPVPDNVEAFEIVLISFGFIF